MENIIGIIIILFIVGFTLISAFHRLKAED